MSNPFCLFFSNIASLISDISLVFIWVTSSFLTHQIYRLHLLVLDVTLEFILLTSILLNHQIYQISDCNT
ncbi:hypothetical protein P3S67_022136 [Capsicum chacoense]